MKLWFEDLDRDCGALSLAARGAWMWILGDLHRAGGERSLTLEGWSRVIRASISQTAAVLVEIINSGTCDSNMSNVTRDALVRKSDGESDACITIRCRRIFRETIERRQHAARQRKYRINRKSSPKPETSTQHSSPSTGKRSDAESDGLVTPIEADADAYIEKERNTKERKRAPSARSPALARRLESSFSELQSRFERFWSAYPRHEARQAAWKAFQKLEPNEELLAAMLHWIGQARAAPQWQNLQFIPHAATWLNQRRWEGDPPPKRASTAFDQIGQGVEDAELSQIARLEYAAAIRAKPPTRRTPDETQFLEWFEVNSHDQAIPGDQACGLRAVK